MTKQVGEWVDINDKLPNSWWLPNDQGIMAVNSVIVRYKNRPECSSEFQTSNTVYVNKFPEKFTHWAYINDPEGV
jgi:hypothetical protein